MPLEIPKPEPRKVRKVRVQIGDEWAQHDFGREVDLVTARERAMHFLDVMTEVRAHD